MNECHEDSGRAHHWVHSVLAVLLAAAAGCSTDARAPLSELGTSRQAIWDAWQDITDAAGTGFGQAIVSNYFGGVDVAWLDYSDVIVTRHWDGLSWSGVVSSGAPTGGGAYSSGPVVAIRGTSQDMAINGGDGNYYHNVRLAAGTWPSPWSDNLGAPPGAAPIHRPPGISTEPAFGPAGTVDVWARGNDNHLYRDRWPGSGAWTGWIDMTLPPYSLNATTLASPPSAIERSSGVVDIVWEDASTNVMHVTWTESTSSFGAVENLGGSITYGPAVSARNGNRIDVWARGAGSDNRVWNNNWIKGLGWSGWTVGPGAPPWPYATESVPAAWDTGSETFIAVNGGTGEVWLREWYDEPVVAPAGDKLVTGAGSYQWENTSLVVPAGNAACVANGAPNGAAFFSFGNAAGVWRGDLSCFTSATSSSCGPLGSVASLANPSVPGFIDSIGASSDNQMARLTDGELMVLHQGVRCDITGNGCDPNAGFTNYRGVEYVYVSSDCGASWSLRYVLDPKSYGLPGQYSAPNHNAYANQSDAGWQGGMDRPELYVDPWTGTVYVTVTGGGSGTAKLLLSSATNGKTWTLIPQPATPLDPGAGGTVMTSVPSGRLYILGCRSSSADTQPIPWHFDTRLTWYDPGTPAIAPEVTVDPLGCSLLDAPGSWATPRGLLWTSGNPTISRAGTSYQEQANGMDNLRLGYPQTILDGGYVYEDGGVWSYDGGSFVQNLKVLAVQVAGTTVTVGDSKILTSGTAGGSIVLAQFIETDRMELATTSTSNVAPLYWYETTATPQVAGSPANNYNANACGTLRAKMELASGALVLSDRYSLAYDAGVSNSWTWLNQTNTPGVPGDYQKGAFWYDAATNKLKFLTQWVESPGGNSAELHANVVIANP
jgi:hypothetical protein